MALSDNQVSKQIEHMIAFIQNESQEKSEEIHAKVSHLISLSQGELVNFDRMFFCI